MERSILILWHFLHFTVQFRSTCLVNAALFLQTACANSLQDTENTSSINISSKLRRVETYLHMALCCKIVYFSWAHLTNDLNERHRVAEVAVMQVEVRFSLKMSDALTIIDRRATDNAVHFISFFEKELREITTILTCYTSNQCYFSIFHFSFFCHSITLFQWWRSTQFPMQETSFSNAGRVLSNAGSVLLANKDGTITI